MFPMAETYQAWLPHPGQLVREAPSTGPFRYSERHLQCVWADSRFRPTALVSTDGEPVRVVDPGRWNLEAGPDFMDATLIIGTGERHVQGDVEIHVRPSDWMAHGHAADSRYSRVIAHVTYFPGETAPSSLPAGAIQLSLADRLSATTSFSFESIDVTAYPFARVRETPPPCATVMCAWPPEKRAAVLEAAGQQRLLQKALRMADRAQASGADDLLYEELMGALGYKHNATPFRMLAQRVPLDALRSAPSPLDAYAILAGVSGLLPPTFASRWSDDAKRFMRSVWDSWWKQQDRWERRIMTADEWRRAGVRPQNHPLRRMAAAVAIFHPAKSIAEDILHVDAGNAEGWRRAVMEHLRPDDATEFWGQHLGLSAPKRDQPVALIGTRRLSSILSNVIVPFCAAAGKNVSGLLAAIPPEEENTHTRNAADVLFGRDHNPALHNTSGLRQQGLMQIFHDFCITDRTGCRECPFPKALREYDEGRH